MRYLRCWPGERGGAGWVAPPRLRDRGGERLAGGGRGGRGDVAAGVLAGELGVAELDQAVEGVGDRAGGVAEHAGDLVRGQAGAGVAGEVVANPVAELAGAHASAG